MAQPISWLQAEGVVKKPPAKPADAGEGGGGGAPEPPPAEPESKPVKKPAVQKVGVVICIKAWVNHRLWH